MPRHLDGALALLIAACPVMAAAAQTTTPNDSVPCSICHDAPHFGRAFGEMVLFELAPYSYNRWVGKKDEDQTTLQSWWYNLRRGWSFDNNDFSVNHFEHPYSGAIYYNSARSHGYGFWRSAMFPMVGSALWEYFGEKQQPSINDQINTTVGGIILGEMMYRLSSAILDDHTTGAGRVVREIGAGLVDPPRGLARLFERDGRGTTLRAEDRLPNGLRSHMELGMFRQDHILNRRQTSYGSDQLFASFSLAAGDPLLGVRRPFDALRIEVATATGGSSPSTEARVLGFLGARDLVRHPRVDQQLAGALHFHYNQNRAFVTGGEGLSGGLLSRYRLGAGLSIRTELWVTGIVLGAVKPDSGTRRTARDTSARGYDYGSGGGARLLVRLDRGRQTLIDIGYQPFWYGILSGAARSHFYDVASARLQLPLVGPAAVGVRQVVYHRLSRYADRPMTRIIDGQTQLFSAFSF
jgi:hypothetical protein